MRWRGRYAFTATLSWGLFMTYMQWVPMRDTAKMGGDPKSLLNIGRCLYWGLPLGSTILYIIFFAIYRNSDVSFVLFHIYYFSLGVVLPLSMYASRLLQARRIDDDIVARSTKMVSVVVDMHKSPGSSRSPETPSPLASPAGGPALSAQAPPCVHAKWQCAQARVPVRARVA